MNILLNGIGRIGKAIIKIATKTKKLNIVAINELNSNIKNIAYSINYDSTYGVFDDKFQCFDNFIKNKTTKIKVLNYTNLLDIDFEKLNIDTIIDASGSKVDTKNLNLLKVKNIFLTHSTKKANINIILGVNENKLNLKKHKIISTSSCNATALLPILKLIEENFGIKSGDITTIHPLLNHQKVLDSTCVANENRDIECNFEFGRSATQNIIPSGTTTIDACSLVLPNINSNLISSSSLRVPTATVGAINVTLFVKKKCKKNKLLKLFNDFEKNQKSKILLNNYEQLVSSDFKMLPYSCILDHRFTDIKKQKMVKLLVWYDNEWGYASKVVDIVSKN
jgi:glyceraldehyde 3-phosphate dehydrogenase